MSTRRLEAKLMHGPTGEVADELDNLGSNATVGELSCALVNVLRAYTSQLRTIDALSMRVVSLQELVDTQGRTIESMLQTMQITSDRFTTVHDRITDLATRLSKGQP